MEPPDFFGPDIGVEFELVGRAELADPDPAPCACNHSSSNSKEDKGGCI